MFVRFHIAEEFTRSPFGVQESVGSIPAARHYFQLDAGVCHDPRETTVDDFVDGRHFHGPLLFWLKAFR
jgi:hypothetical protein